MPGEGPLKSPIGRRRFLRRGLGLASVWLAGCDALSRTDWFPRVLGVAEPLTRRAQRLVTPRSALAREYTEADLSPVFPTNGNTNPRNPLYQAHLRDGFVDWVLEVEGLVARPARLSLDDLFAFPSRTQITRHDCVEGWSAIGKWTGVPLHALLDRVDPLPEARYVVFHCADPDEFGAPYYESLDFDDAYHAQTILAYALNDRPLPVGHGAPLRLRVERQLGYKMAKYVMRIELASSLTRFGQGRGGYWEDQGYEWYAGI